MMSKSWIAGVAAVIASLTTGGLAWGRTAANVHNTKDFFGGKSAVVGSPAHCCAAHRVGRIELGINNNGTFGNGFTVGPKQDCFTGEGVPSCEYPKRSDVEYLYAAAFWIGAVVDRDTLVSAGADGWSSAREMYPDQAPFGNMIKRSIIDPTKPEYVGAISEEDYVGVYSDTYVQGVEPDPIANRPHRPLHIEVTEGSYAWSYSYAEDIVLFDYKIRNIGVKKLENVYMGIYVDADVCYDCDNTNGYSDDLCGFLQTYPANCAKCQYLDTVNIAWIADNDGDFSKMVAAPHVTGTRVIRTPADKLDVSFNWWISNSASALDFGPREQSEKGRWKEKFRDFGTAGLGTPEGDANKYYIMRNMEFDYDQAYTATIKRDDTLWLYPGADAAAFSNGYDTRYLLSFGPFNITPGDVLPISFAYVAGANFHSVRGNIANLPDRPDIFYSNLSFTGLAKSSKWASWIYDNPGVDTDGDDDFGPPPFICVLETAVRDSIWDADSSKWDYLLDTLKADTCWTRGDGVPDFKGASPPPAPALWLEPSVGKIRVRFNGLRSETTKDVFSHVLDFEGYRVYCGRDERAESYSVVASYDIEDYTKWVYNERKLGGPGYELTENPFTRERLQCVYGDSCGGTGFDPLAWSRSRPFIPTTHPESSFYFEPQDYNASVLGVTTRIDKIYKNQAYPSTLIPENARPDELTEDGYLKYFEYEIVIEDLLPTVPYWVNVTAFDFGSPPSGLPSLETAVTIGAKNAYPQPTSAQVKAENLQVYVYPNPYRTDGGYREEGFEGRTETIRPNDRIREIHFVNVPPKCTIRIYTLDGDLVREIQHDVPTSDPEASHASWDLITRNTQLAVSGLYYWTVEGDGAETQIGKLVLIM